MEYQMFPGFLVISNLGKTHSIELLTYKYIAEVHRYIFRMKYKKTCSDPNLMLTKNFHLFKKIIIIIITAFYYSKNSQTSVSEQKYVCTYLYNNRNLTILQKM